MFLSKPVLKKITLDYHVRLQLTNNDVADRPFEPLGYGNPKIIMKS